MGLSQNRKSFQKFLEELLGSPEVWFQSPPDVQMKYPAIVYDRDIETQHADNKPFIKKSLYNLTVIDPDPDSVIVEKISELPSCRHIRHFAVDDLNHDLFSLYFKE